MLGSAIMVQAWRSVVAGGVVLATATGVAGCSSHPERAATIVEPSTAEAVRSSAAEAGDSARSELTTAQVEAALPQVVDFPTGWSTDPDRTVTKDDDDSADETVEPARCEAVFKGLRDNAKIKESVRADADFTAGALGPFLGVTIKSFPNDFDTSTFTDLTSGLSKCPKFTMTKAGEKTSYTASALSFPKLGDATYAVRLTAASSEITAGFDVVGIAVGHNLVQVGQVGVGGSGDAKVMETVARKVIERLGKQ